MYENQARVKNAALRLMTFDNDIYTGGFAGGKCGQSVPAEERRLLRIKVNSRELNKWKSISARRTPAPAAVSCSIFIGRTLLRCRGDRSQRRLSLRHSEVVSVSDHFRQNGL